MTSNVLKGHKTEIKPNQISTAILTADSSRAVIIYWQKNVHLVLVNRLGLSLPRKGVVRSVVSLDMTIAVDWDVKPQNNRI